MKPASPVINEFKPLEIILAKNQPQYLPLPALPDADGGLTTRWEFSWRERLAVLFFGNLYLRTLTFGQPLQPISLSVFEPEIERSRILHGRRPE